MRVGLGSIIFPLARPGVTTEKGNAGWVDSSAQGVLTRSSASPVRSVNETEANKKQGDSSTPAPGLLWQTMEDASTGWNLMPLSCLFRGREETHAFRRTGE